MQLYRQKAVFKREGVAFESKVEMVVHQIEAFESLPGTQNHMLIISWYHCRKVSHSVQKRNWESCGGLRSNPVMRLIDEQGERQGLRLSAYDAQHQWDD